MLWKEIKTWAKSRGYQTDRKKLEIKTEEEHNYHYTWFKIDDESINGEATSVSKVATAIYNHMTDNKHLEYQREYKENEAKKDIEHETGGWG